MSFFNMSFFNSRKLVYNKSYLSYNLATPKIDAIDYWVQNNINIKRSRYIALCLFSKRRCTGKSYFAINGIYNSDRVIVFRSFLRYFTPPSNPQLCVVDDLSMSDLEQNICVYKQILTGQPTTMYVKYANHDWPYCVPCIVTTNDIQVVHKFLHDPMFNESVQVIQISDNETMTDPSLILRNRQSIHNVLDESV